MRQNRIRTQSYRRHDREFVLKFRCGDDLSRLLQVLLD